jgi:hypothetical protein
VLGVHKIGKSSLLSQLLRQSQASQWVTAVSVELNAAVNAPNKFYELIYNALGMPLPANNAGGAGSAAGPAVADIHSHFHRQIAAFCKLKQAKNASHRLLFVIDECGYLTPDLSGCASLPFVVRTRSSPGLLQVGAHPWLPVHSGFSQHAAHPTRHRRLVGVLWPLDCHQHQAVLG